MISAKANAFIMQSDYVGWNYTVCTKLTPLKSQAEHKHPFLSSILPT